MLIIRFHPVGHRGFIAVLARHYSNGADLLSRLDTQQNVPHCHLLSKVVECAFITGA
ncbi:hypothetical protein D3C81_860620 [compost metagenome]